MTNVVRLVRFEVPSAVIMQTDALQSGTSVPTFHGNLMEPTRCSETSVTVLRRHSVQNSFMQLRVPMRAMKEIDEEQAQVTSLGCTSL